jgi:hypothetical protein
VKESTVSTCKIKSTKSPIEILRKGGVLQVVDRGEPPASDFLREDTLNAHREQASVTSLKVTDLQFTMYEEPKKVARR